MNPVFSTASAIARAIRRRELTAAEAVQSSLSRIEAVNPQLNAVVQVGAEAALEAARAADATQARGEPLGPLHGVPMTIKDSFATAGVVTTAGTRGLAGHVPERDATVVSRLRWAGAIMLGKTNTPEITLSSATDNYVYGRTNNPYDPGRTPGGSSGGAAAIVAAGGSAFDMGSDTGGSIRLPSHFCGLAGLKPTAGRVPRTGHTPFLEFGAAQAITQVGPLARSVEDLVLVLSVIAGPDWRDPQAVPMPLGEAAAVELPDLRVAFYAENGLVAPSPETASVLQNAVAALADRGATLVEDLPPGLAAADRLWNRLIIPDGGATVRQILQGFGTSAMHPSLQWTQEIERLDLAEYLAMLDEWNLFRSAGLAFMENYDAILCPVAARPAIRHDEPEDVSYADLFMHNLLGWPVVVVRCGGTPEGLPIGLQVAARPWREDVALAVAAGLEAALGGWQPPPM
jgi:amidase